MSGFNELKSSYNYDKFWVSFRQDVGMWCSFCDMCFQQFFNAEVKESGLFLARGRHAPVDVQKQN